MTYFFNRIEINPIIAAVNDLEKLDMALESPCEIIFILTGNIFNLKEISNRVRNKNKGLYIYVDSIDGFSKDTWGLEYIIKNIYPDGIITEKDTLIKLSKDMGVFTIQRLIISDSKSLEYTLNTIKRTRPNVVDILPGIMPKITGKDDLKSSLDAGAIAISTSNKSTWYL